MSLNQANYNPEIKYGAPTDNLSFVLTAASVSFPLFVANQGYKVAGVRTAFGTTSTSGTLQLEVCSDGTALGAGTSVLSSTLALSGTVNTTTSGTVSAGLITSGQRLNVIIAGTMTGLANCIVTVALTRR